MKYLISGATGFIGAHLLRRLTAEGHSAICIVRPTSTPPGGKGITAFVFDGDVGALTKFLAEQSVDGVVHLASKFLSQHQPEDIAELIGTNVRFSTQLLEAAASAGVPWFINTGTFWQHFENEIYSPTNLYASTKQAFEDIAQYYIATTKTIFVTLKLSDTFGPGDTRPKLFTLWKKISKSGEPLDMSPGEQLIDVSYIDNVIDAYERLIHLLSEADATKLNGHTFAVMANERMSLKELAKVFEETTKTKLNINWGKREYRPREVMVPWKNGTVIPGWKPVVSLREGIKRFFDEP